MKSYASSTCLIFRIKQAIEVVVGHGKPSYCGVHRPQIYLSCNITLDVDRSSFLCPLWVQAV